ncbi:putative RNA-directed DNA polymerase [Helianthus debilis subsp. tardiflorus]
MASKQIVPLTAATHFPIKLTSNNFPSWRKQVLSTLIGLELDHHITGTPEPPAQKIVTGEVSKPNPDYLLWFRQDQMIISALLGSCSDAIQPLVSSADTARHAWNTLNASYASGSRSRIISLKSKLSKNPKGTRSVTDFLHDMKSISDELAIAQSPIDEEDRVIHTMNQLGDEFAGLVQSLKSRDTTISFAQLFDKLLDHERTLKDTSTEPIITTVNHTHRQPARNYSRQQPETRYQRPAQQPSSRPSWTNRDRTQVPNHTRNARNNAYCHFCNIPGHETKDCRKLGRFLRDYNYPVQGSTGSAPSVNYTAASTTTGSVPSWMWDTGATGHTAPNQNSLPVLSEYGGPDEIDLRTGAHLMRGVNINDVYYGPFPSSPQVNATGTRSLLAWHHTLGHPSLQVFKSLLTKLGLHCNKVSHESFHCKSCSLNKSHKLPFGQNSFIANKPLELIYSDVWGPVATSIDGFNYYVIFVDFFSKYIWLYPIKKKSDVSTLFPQFKTLVERYFKTPLLSLFTDNGGEYIGLKPYLTSHGISHYTTPPHTPEQNGVAERRHRHVVETGLALLHYANLPQTFWSHAFQTATYLINRLPTPILSNKTPCDMLFGKPPDYTKLKPFGCLCYPWLRPYTTSKLQSRSHSCIFLGYSTSRSAFKCFDPTTSKLYHSRHVEFIPHIFLTHPTELPNSTPPQSYSFPIPFSDTLTSSTTPTSSTSSTDSPPSTTSIPIPPLTTPAQCLTQSTTLSTLPSSYSNEPSMAPNQAPSSTPTFEPTPTNTTSSPTTPANTTPTSASTENQSTSFPPNKRQPKPNSKYFNPNFINSTTIHPLPSTLEPNTHTQAMKDPQWRHAMDLELNALVQNHTWELVPRTTQNVIGCKWIFRIKRKADGTIDKYKARLVAKGFHQQFGKDYFDTFSPVTKPVTIRTVLSIALSKRWPLHQLDVNNAFLHGTLHEDVYMIQPPGFANSEFPNHICKLRKSLYGLKQAPRAWYNELTSFLLRSGFRKSISDPSLFIYQHHNVTCYLLVYVDDIVLTGSDTSFLESFIRSLGHKFSIKDLGLLHHFLGIEVIPTPQGLFLSQHRHIQDVLTSFKMDGAKDVLTPLSVSDPLSSVDSTPPIDPTPYRKLVGSLQYLAFTRPDISFAINKLSQFMHSPRQSHWQALKRVLRYLKGTVHHGLYLHRDSPLTLRAFSDSDWGGVHNAGRSTTAYILYLGSNIISWRSSRQKTVSRSSTEAEYKAVANAAAEISWVQNLLQELGIKHTHIPQLFCDNTGATYLCANPVYHSKMKHVALDYHFVREQVNAGKLQVMHISSKDQLADVLTKPLPRMPFISFRSKIGVSNGSSILRGHINNK